ncbi:MAG TPA: glycosyltransferase family 4 protein [Actinoplanes sp.]|jgi:glycogen(starch) synthase
MTRDVAVVTPWYPSAQMPFRGAFVRAMVEATAPGTVYHTEVWAGRLSSDLDAEVGRAYRALLPSATLSSRTVGGAELVSIPVPMPRGRPFAEQAHRSALALQWALGGAPIPAPVVHAHVGLLGGLPALRRKRSDARLFVTEHATFLDRMLAEPDGHAGYVEVLAGCEAFFVVGDPIREQLADAFPAYAHKLRLIPNPIDFDAPRPAPVTALCRWLFVGGLIERKGVRWLLEAFAICRRDDPALTLTLVGEGELRPELEQRAAELGVAEFVRFVGAVPPARALRLMHEHDVLVHPSRYETFGVVVMEAVAAGLPVIVTRCGGPEQTLAGFESQAGELIDVEDGPDAIVAGFRRLRDRFPGGIDVEAVRRALAERFGYQAVTRMHHEAWFEEGHARPVSGARR